MPDLLNVPPTTEHTAQWRKWAHSPWFVVGVICVAAVVTAFCGRWYSQHRYAEHQVSLDGFEISKPVADHPEINLLNPKPTSLNLVKFDVTVPTGWKSLSGQPETKGMITTSAIYYDSSLHSAQDIVQALQSKEGITGMKGIVIIADHTTGTDGAIGGLQAESNLLNTQADGQDYRVASTSDNRIVGTVTHNSTGVAVYARYDGTEPPQEVIDLVRSVRLKNPGVTASLNETVKWLLPHVDSAKAFTREVGCGGMHSYDDLNHMDNNMPEEIAGIRARSDALTAAFDALNVTGDVSCNHQFNFFAIALDNWNYWDCAMKMKAMGPPVAPPAFLLIYNQATCDGPVVDPNTGITTTGKVCLGQCSEAHPYYTRNLGCNWAEEETDGSYMGGMTCVWGTPDGDYLLSPSTSGIVGVADGRREYKYIVANETCAPTCQDDGGWMDCSGTRCTNGITPSVTPSETIVAETPTPTASFSPSPSAPPPPECITGKESCTTGNAASCQAYWGGVCTNKDCATAKAACDLGVSGACDYVDDTKNQCTPPTAPPPTPPPYCTDNKAECKAGGDIGLCDGYWGDPACEKSCTGAHESCLLGSFSACDYESLNNCQPTPDKTLTVKIEGTVFVDRDGDGKQHRDGAADLDEPGLQGATVSVGVTDAPFVKGTTVTTDSNGKYSLQQVLTVPFNDSVERCVDLEENGPMDKYWQHTVPSDGVRHLCFTTASTASGGTILVGAGNSADFGNSTLKAQLQVSPPGTLSGDTETTLAVTVTGEARGTINYKFWWNCPTGVFLANAGKPVTFSHARQLCGEPEIPIGEYADGMGSSPGTGTETYSPTHVFSLDGAPSPKSFAPFVVVERSAAPIWAASGAWVIRTTDIVPEKPTDITGTVFVDADGDGVQDAGEVGVAGATVKITDQSGLAAPVERTTDGNGFYTVDINPMLATANRNGMNYKATMVSMGGDWQFTVPSNGAHDPEYINKGDHLIKNYGISSIKAVMSSSRDGSRDEDTSTTQTDIAVAVSGEARGMVRYSVWWDCKAGVDATATKGGMTMAEARAVCGSEPSDIFDGPSSEPKPGMENPVPSHTVSHQYVLGSVQTQDFYPFVVTERLRADYTPTIPVPAMAGMKLTRTRPTKTTELSISPTTGTGTISSGVSLNWKTTGIANGCTITSSTNDGLAGWDPTGKLTLSKDQSVNGSSNSLGFSIPPKTSKTWSFVLSCDSNASLDKTSSYRLEDTGSGGTGSGSPTQFCGGD